MLLPLLVALLRLDSLHDRFDTLGFDFRGDPLGAGGQDARRREPVPGHRRRAIASGNPSVYPPLPITMAIPLTRLGFDAALTIWLLVLVASVVGALLLVGVRDWRCLRAGPALPSVVEGLFFGNSRSS